MEKVLQNAISRFYLSNICNVDETLLPFRYLSGRTYDTISFKTVWIKESKSSWDKQQASLVFCILQDGFDHGPLMIVFYGQGLHLDNEWSKYHPRVIVEFNEKVYIMDILFLKYVKLYLIPVREGRPTSAKASPHLGT